MDWFGLETTLGKICVEEAKDSLHIGLLRFSLLIICIFSVAISIRRWSWLNASVL